VAASEDTPFCVGFSAESENVEAHAADKRRRKNIPLIAANLVQDAFGSEQNELILIDEEGTHRLPRSSKLHQARGLIRHITRLYKPTRKSITTAR
ncbi:MAG: phosphopantothenate synthase, partial [Burkholderiales bacterium]|nr:phosphopantothenate synthase [Burkholderiales bacterium]